ncbi:hypothetical protein GCM10023205_04460 [Yinghuangia aomiensis]|uniref:Uncharacterized protein n=1 Tax=Yinghuangia aomiensis TaxID=676205 RepID=A0ABP9GP12_9ACTN
MTRVGGVRHFGFDLLPEAVTDMDSVPREVRAEAMDVLYEVARGRVRGRPLEGHRGQEELNGCRRLYLGDADWRLVYVETPRRSGDLGARGVLVVAVGPRARGDVYTTAAERLRTLRAAQANARINPLAAAARLRPGTAPTASAVRAVPATAAPAAHPTRTRTHR